MMAQPDWGVQGGLRPYTACELPNDALEDDFVTAALLFLDYPHGETDSESPCTPDPSPRKERECPSVDWSLGSERPAKLPRTSTSSNAVKLEPEYSPVKWDVARGDTISHLSTLWESEQHHNQFTAPRRVNKRKEEIKTLREQAEVLQDRLDWLQGQPFAGSFDAALTMAGEPTWKLVACHELKQRKRSESDNRRLKEVVAEHKSMASALKRVAARRLNSKVWDPYRPRQQYPHGAFRSTRMLDSPDIFARMLVSLEQMVLQTDLMLSNTPGRALSCERHGDTQMTVKLHDSRLLPFGSASTASAVWDYTLLRENGRQNRWSSASDGSFVCEFAAYVDLGQFRGQAEGKLVARRVEERDRVIIVRHSMFHCVTPGKTNRFLTVPISHLLWIVIDRPKHVEGVSSRIRMCTMSTPRLDVGDLHDPTREADIKELQDMCTRIAIQQSEQCHGIVDNLLLGTPLPADTKGVACQAALNRCMSKHTH